MGQLQAVVENQRRFDPAVGQEQAPGLMGQHARW
jgi:hypothetical protein